MASILDGILASGVVTDAEGEKHSLDSNTSRRQCEFLRDVIGKIDARICLEVGLAYGISTLAICESIHVKARASLVSIDPFQQAHWSNIGRLNVERAGYAGIVEFHQAMSHDVLPVLLKEGRRIDFAYVDTSKIFDVVLVDAFFITRLLEVGGVVVFDDCSWPGVRAMVRYLASWPHLEVFATHGEERLPPARRIASSLGKLVPFRDRIFRPEVIRTDKDLGIAAPCVAFRKVAEDERPWDWSLHP